VKPSPKRKIKQKDEDKQKKTQENKETRPHASNTIKDKIWKQKHEAVLIMHGAVDKNT